MFLKLRIIKSKTFNPTDNHFCCCYCFIAASFFVFVFKHHAILFSLIFLVIFTFLNYQKLYISVLYLWSIQYSDIVVVVAYFGFERKKIKSRFFFLSLFLLLPGHNLWPGTEGTLTIIIEHWLRFFFMAIYFFPCWI